MIAGGEPRRTERRTRNGDQLDAFVGFCAGLATAALVVLGYHVLQPAVPLGVGGRHVVVGVAAVLGLAAAVLTSRGLAARAVRGRR
ncbi:hypothetical protein [Kitasatospora sp. LaBMicrA B282]|uniref:hypothetical protein n=1 Tax=Kitasatospora sp. LaBMicrA B282 TaxID=3420949 RepID=UPI003D145008